MSGVEAPLTKPDTNELERPQSGVGPVARVGRVALVVVLYLGLLAVAAAALIGALSWRLPWPGDLFAPFRLQYAALFLGAGVVAVVLRQRAAAVLAVALFLWQAVSLVPLVVEPDRGEPSGGSVRLVHANVLAPNDNYADVAAWVAEQDADVIFLQEATPAWGRAMAKATTGLLSGWEVVDTGTVQPGTHGVMLLVRSGLDVTGVDVVVGRHPTVAVTVNVDGRALLIYSLHTVIPLYPGGTRIADAQIDVAAQTVVDHGGPAVVVGDLNATRWSPVYRRLMDQVELRDAADGSGLTGTWPTRLWFTGRIGIDHVLVTPEVCSFNRRLGPDNGSDHLPIVIDLSASGCS